MNDLIVVEKLADWQRLNPHPATIQVPKHLRGHRDCPLSIAMHFTHLDQQAGAGPGVHALCACNKILGA